MSSWLWDLGAGHRYLFSVLWELREILLLSSTGHVALLGEFRHLENREGKRIKQKQSQKRLSRST